MDNDLTLSLSDAEIIEHCQQATSDLFLTDLNMNNQVVKLTEDLVVKFGFLIREDEAQNQAKAHELLDPSIVRVPRVYRYCMDSERYGYIVMEYMHGERRKAKSSSESAKSINIHDESTERKKSTDHMKGERKKSSSESTNIHALSRILQHFASIKGPNPGSLTGGASDSSLFGETRPTFTSVEELERWFNRRLLDPDPTAHVSFAGQDLVLCHLDLFPRNILWLEGQPPCVLDWATAGFFPRILERCSQLFSSSSDEYKSLFDQPLSPSEAVQVDRILQAAWNNM
ncbi:hypothetical protein A1O3_04951 [Capronia epimyces CBS 606.96]|uniref:Aminoglycoside phosphotransferase domain-containing protein n=1 Tax=Capronia epimyces CBS 606.96 TaxID=1182542 RepID=W9YPV0_9EURO|nr:uncharacterized protein A1O3_04951 [Capronia epimyces CBS 606.96]EXJ84284.1 hypothetical protein A1O3_04951 [Capronia epimyces CBS 606.96]